VKYTIRKWNIPNDHKITKLLQSYQTAVKFTKRRLKYTKSRLKYTKRTENIPTFSIQGSPKRTQIWIFWYKNVPSGNPAWEEKKQCSIPRVRMIINGSNLLLLVPLNIWNVVGVSCSSTGMTEYYIFQRFLKRCLKKSTSLYPGGIRSHDPLLQSTRW
jgi:hypothetical protein